ncbi:MAG: YigZ family protein [Eubacteriales bacterium]|nr:YigZ family protein [Eubacteriales bacterium]
MAQEQEYRTIAQTGYGEYEEKKSRFLAEALFADSAEAADAELARIRKQHYDARHHCSARILGVGMREERSSDDGEPSGTAGKPILDCLRGSGCTNAIVVVTRYFGGTLLGTGGLVRAYSKAAADALANARIVTMCLCHVVQMTFDYSHTDRVLYYLRQNGLETGEQEYTDRVRFTVTLRPETEALLRRDLTAQTNGGVTFSVLREGYFGLQE